MTHREGSVPVQQKVYCNMIFIKSESRFIGISLPLPLDMHNEPFQAFVVSNNMEEFIGIYRVILRQGKPPSILAG